MKQYFACSGDSKRKEPLAPPLFRHFQRSGQILDQPAQGLDENALFEFLNQNPLANLQFGFAEGKGGDGELLFGSNHGGSIYRKDNLNRQGYFVKPRRTWCNTLEYCNGGQIGCDGDVID